MKKIRLLFVCLTVSLVSLMCRPAVAQIPKPASSNSIVAGKSAGPLKIGDTKARVFQLYPKLKRTEYYESKECRGAAEMYFPDSLSAYFQDGRVSQILIQSNYPAKTLETAEKIKPGSTPAQVKKSYPSANKTFTKLNSIAVSTGYAPLIYWVDYQSGIALEFYTDSAKGRLVNKIHIFAPGGKMLFGGSCQTDEDLKELPPFAVTVPEKMIRDYEKQL